MSEPFVHRATVPTEEEKAAASERLKTTLPHLYIAANMARLGVPDGEVKLGIIVVAPGGGGRVTCQFEAASFLSDLEVLVGPLLTKDEDDGPKH